METLADERRLDAHLLWLLAGKAVHQPTAVAYTVVPERFGHYLRQQLRWMRGTFVRTWWWFRYMPLRDATFWMPLTELFALRPLIFYAMATCWKTGWGTRQQVEVASATPRQTGHYRWYTDPWTAAAAAGIIGCLAVALHRL